MNASWLLQSSATLSHLPVRHSVAIYSSHSIKISSAYCYTVCANTCKLFVVGKKRCMCWWCCDRVNSECGRQQRWRLGRCTGQHWGDCATCQHCFAGFACMYSTRHDSFTAHHHVWYTNAASSRRRICTSYNKNISTTKNVVKKDLELKWKLTTVEIEISAKKSSADNKLMFSIQCSVSQYSAAVLFTSAVVWVWPNVRSCQWGQKVKGHMRGT